MKSFFQRRNRNKTGPLYDVTVFGKTDVGKVRPQNEDCYKIIAGKDAPDGVDAVMIVADGMGGHAAGEIASGIAVDGVIRRLTDGSTHSTKFGQKYLQYLEQVLCDVNEEVHIASKTPKFRGMGTTCTVGVLKGSDLYIVHVGDSRAYLMQSGKLIQVTKDHSWISEQVEAGNISADEAKKHPYRNVVTRSIGTDGYVKVDSLTQNISTGNRILLCSDGLHSVVADSAIGEVLNQGTVEESCNCLVELANVNGGPDNITVLVAHLVDM